MAEEFDMILCDIFNQYI